MPRRDRILALGLACYVALSCAQDASFNLAPPSEDLNGQPILPGEFAGYEILWDGTGQAFPPTTNGTVTVKMGCGPHKLVTIFYSLNATGEMAHIDGGPIRSDGPIKGYEVECAPKALSGLTAK